MSNSRRRFLGLLGFLGLPTSLWAQDAAAPAAPAGPPSIVCDATLVDTKAATVTYRRKFQLIDGRLITTDDGEEHYVVLGPTKTQYADGYSSNGTMGTLIDGIAFDDPQVTLYTHGQDSFRSTFSMYLASTTPLTALSVVLVTKSVQTPSTSTSFDLNADTKDYDVEADWNPTPADVLSGLFEVALYSGQALIAVFDFDATPLGYAKLLADKDRQVTARTGLTLNETSKEIDGMAICKVDDGSDTTCFFTTAAAGTLGLSDDCWELRTLRAFRDGLLSLSPAGRALVDRYYDEAPRLVAAVNRRHDAVRQWLGAYWLYILPCAVMARLGLTGLAVSHYTRLFNRLAAA